MIENLKPYMRSLDYYGAMIKLLEDINYYASDLESVVILVLTIFFFIVCCIIIKTLLIRKCYDDGCETKYRSTSKSYNASNDKSFNDKINNNNDDDDDDDSVHNDNSGNQGYSCHLYPSGNLGSRRGGGGGASGNW